MLAKIVLRSSQAVLAETIRLLQDWFRTSGRHRTSRSGYKNGSTRKLDVMRAFVGKNTEIRVSREPQGEIGSLTG